MRLIYALITKAIYYFNDYVKRIKKRLTKYTVFSYETYFFDNFKNSF